MAKIVIFIILLLLSFGCATQGPLNKPAIDCPPQDIVIGTVTNLGFTVVIIPKGHLNPDKQNENWFTIEDYKLLMEKHKKGNLIYWR